MSIKLSPGGCFATRLELKQEWNRWCCSSDGVALYGAAVVRWLSQPRQPILKIFVRQHAVHLLAPNLHGGGLTSGSWCGQLVINTADDFNMLISVLRLPALHMLRLWLCFLVSLDVISGMGSIRHGYARAIEIWRVC
jgi:hypothetical protein